MSDIWSRAWCETQQIPNFALKGMTPSNEVRDAPNYIPRVNSNPTQYGSIYDNSRSSSPEAKEILCFQFRKKENKKTRTPMLSRKSKTVLEKVPNFKSPASHPPSPGPSSCPPPASPGQVRVVRRPSITSSSASSGYQQPDISIPGLEKLPDVVANSATVRSNKNDRRPVVETVQDSPVPTRNCAHSNIPPRNIKHEKTEIDNISKLQDLEIENQRLKEIFQDNSMTPLNKKQVMTNSTENSERKNTAHETGKVHKEQSKPKTALSSTLNCMTSEKSPHHEHNKRPSHPTNKHFEPGTRNKTEAQPTQKVNHNSVHRSVTDLQGSAPSTPAQGSRRMSKTCLKGNFSNTKSSSHATDKKSSKMSPFNSQTAGYVFIGSSGQVLAECKGYSSQVIVKNVRSSVGDSWVTAEDKEGSEEEFEVEKILAAQKLREISMRMEKSKIVKIKSERSIAPCTKKNEQQ